MNLACGDNLQINPSSATVSTTGTAGLLVAASLLTDNRVVDGTTVAKNAVNPNGYSGLWMDVTSNVDLLGQNTATDVVNAGLTNSPLTSNAFLTSAQMSAMQEAYKRGTKVFIIRDTTRCYIVPVQTLTDTETTMIATQFSNCRK